MKPPFAITFGISTACTFIGNLSEDTVEVKVSSDHDTFVCYSCLLLGLVLMLASCQNMYALLLAKKEALNMSAMLDVLRLPSMQQTKLECCNICHS